MKIRATVAGIEDRLRPLGTAERAAGEKRYLRSDLEFLGVAVPRIRRSAREWLRRYPEVGRDELVRLVRALWRSRVHELRTFGIELLIERSEDLGPGDLALVEWMLRRANTWAHVDPIAIKIVGPLVDRHPPLRDASDSWSVDDDLWLRRSAVLAHLSALGRGDGDWTRFCRLVDPMLAEREFFIRKAIGWVLREVAKNRPEAVVEFLDRHLDRVSALTLREASLPLSAGERERLARGGARGRAAGRVRQD